MSVGHFDCLRMCVYVKIGKLVCHEILNKRDWYKDGATHNNYVRIFVSLLFKYVGRFVGLFHIYGLTS